MESENYIRKWLEGSLTGEEKKLFEASPEFKSLEKLTDSIQAFRAPKYDVEDELIRLQISKQGMGKAVSISIMQHLLRIAAVLFVIIGVFFYFYLSQSTNIQTAAAEKTNLYLPDSSKVMLNAFTHISFKEKLWNLNRKVKLDGEAYFNVTKGSKFDVETVSGTISVMGTQFNVKNRENYFEVVCYEGLVSVQHNKDISQLPAGNSLRIIDGVLDKGTDLPSRTPSWLQNESEFRSVPVIHVIREFERQYNVSVQTDKVNLEQLFTGKFVHNDKILALRSIAIPLNLKFEVEEGNKIILSGQSD